ncbi:MAG: hypothetical protein RBR82_12125 [Pseudomonas sp.]|nr:hypothetical protein [Pseudomonas sp.]
MVWFDSPEYHRGMAIVSEHQNEFWNEIQKVHTFTTEDFSVTTAAQVLLHNATATKLLINLQQLCPSFIQPHDLNQLHDELLNTQLKLADWVL